MRHGPLSQARNGCERDQGRGRQGARDGGGILAEVEARRDAAVRELSQKFDNWSPASVQAHRAGDRARDHRRSQDAISTTSGSRRRRCAISRSTQKETLRDLEVETLPGVVLGHKHIPVNSIGCYVPGGRYPMVASAHMSIVTARVAGVRAHRRLRAALPGRPASRHRRRHAFRRRRRHLRARRRAGGRRHGARHRDDRRRRHDRRVPAMPMSRRPSASCSAVSASTCWPGRPRR